MPLREYKCSVCQEVFETLILTRQDAKTVVCPSCGNRKVNVLFSTFALSGGRKEGKSTQTSGCGSCSGKSCSTCH